MGIEETYLNIIKVIYDKPTANIILNSERSKNFPPRSGRQQECPLSPLLFNTVPEVIARAIKQDKEIKGTQIRKEEVILCNIVFMNQRNEYCSNVYTTQSHLQIQCNL